MPYLHGFSHYHLLRSKEMGRVYWLSTLSTLGASVAAIFVPIFLLKSGLTFMNVLGYILLQQLLAGLTQLPASKLFKYVHPHHILAAGTLFYALLFGLLSSYSSHHWSIGLLALVWALNRSLYWSAFHYIFILSRGHRISGQQIASWQALAILGTTIAPAIGGIAASLAGINFSYLIAILLLIAAIIPVLSTKDGPPKSDLHLSWHQFMSMRRDALANMFNGIIMIAELNIWPLLVFTLVSSYAGIGILSSVIAASTIAVTLYVGHRQRVRGEHHYIKQGLTAYSLTSLGRALVQNSTQVFGLNLVGGIGRSLYITPFMNRYYHNSDGAYRLGYITIMETAFSIGSAGFIGLLMILALLFSMKDVLAIALGMVAICSLGVRLIR